MLVMYRTLISVLTWGEKKRRCFLHGQIEISYYVQRFNQCLSPTRTPHVRVSIRINFF